MKKSKEKKTMKKSRNIVSTLGVVTLIILSILQGVVAQMPSFVSVMGTVKFSNGTSVPHGWNVTMENLNETYPDEPWTTTTGVVQPCYNYSIDGMTLRGGGSTFIINVSDPLEVYIGSMTFVSPGGFPIYNLTVYPIGDGTDPITNVTAPGEPSPIPSPWMLNWTNANVTLTFNRTDPGATAGINWTNLSLAQASVTSPVNVSIANNSWTWNTTLSKGVNTTVPVNVTLGGVFNVTISDECNATIEYYSVDKNVTANIELPPKNLTVRIDTTEPEVIAQDVLINWQTGVATLNATITDPVVGSGGAPGSGVRNATVNVSKINSSIGEAILNKQGATNNWVNDSIIVDKQITAPVDLPITAYDNASNFNATNMTALPAITGNIRINEIMYDPFGTDTNHEWIELYNNDTKAINIADWKFYEEDTNQGLTLEEGSMVIPAGGYAIIADNATMFLNIDHPECTCTVIDSVFSLHNAGEYIALKNATSDIIDDVTYNASWGAKGNNRTLELNATGGWEESAIDDGTPCVVNSVLGVLTAVTITPSPNEAGWNNVIPVVLSFRRIDPSGTGVNYTNLSSTPSVLVNITNGVLPANQTQTLPLYGSGNNFTVFNGSATPALNHTLNETFNVTISIENTTTIWYYSVDKNATPNVESVKNITVKIDKTKPVVIPIEPAAKWVSNCTDVTLNVTATDVNGSGVKTVSVDVSAINSTQDNVSLDQTPNTNFWTGTIHVSTAETGLQNLTVFAYDNADNVNSSVNLTVRVDNVAPTVAIDLPTEGQNLSSSTVWINGSFSDTTSGVNVSTLVVKVNGTAVTGVNIDESNGYFNYSITLPDDDHNVTVGVNDNASNSAITAMRNFTVDTAAPTVIIDLPAEGQNLSTGTVWINGSFSDTTSGVNVSTLVAKVNGTAVSGGATGGTSNSGYFNYLITLPEGNHNVTVDADDFAGKSATTVMRNFTVDTVAPTVAIDLPTEGQNLSSSTVWINGSFSDTTSGVNVSTLVAKVNGTAVSGGATGGTSNSGYFNYSITLPEGNHNVTVDADDFAGNSATTAMRNFTVDTVAPTVAIDLPTEGQNLSSSTVWINGSFSDTTSGVNTSTLVVKVNGTIPTFDSSDIDAALGCFNYSITIPDGNHNVTVDADDFAGNSATTAMRNFTVDTVKPNVTITTPITSYYKENITVNATVTDPDPSSSIQKVWFRVEKNSNVTKDWTLMNKGVGDNYTKLFDITGVADGNYTINVTAWDYASNANSSNVTNVAIDRTDPTFKIAFATNFTTHITNLSINVSEHLQAGAPVVNVTNETTVTLTDLGGTYPLWNWSYPIITTGTSNYTITVNGTDLAGNYGESVAYSNVTYVTIPKDTPMEISAPPNTSISMTLNTNVDNASIAVTKTDENPTDFARPDAVAFVNINVNATQIKEEYITSVTIRVYYNKSNLPVGTTEDQLAIYWLNETVWERLSSTVNKTGQYVEAIVDHLSTFAAAADTTPPASITSLSHTVGQTWIKWTWNDPVDSDFSHVMVYVDGNFEKNVSKSTEYYSATGLSAGTSYTIGTRTVDTAGNINPTWKNNMATTTAAPAAPRGGGGARVVAPPINVPVDPTTGEITSTTSLTVEKATLTIPAGVIVKDAAGNPLATSITTMHTPSTAKTVGAIAAYDFGPSGTTFSKPIDLVISYDPVDIPAGFSESYLVIKMYDGTAKAWIDLDTSVDTVAHTATAKVSHFSIFALFAAPPVTPTPILTVPPVVTPAPTPIPPVVPPAKLPWGLIIGISVAVIIVGAAAYYFYTKKKT